MGPKLDHDAFNRGVHAYATGLRLIDVVIKSFADMDRANLQENSLDHRAIEAESKCFVLGFASGVIEDIRKIAGGSRGGQRA